jgi:FkbM family methyltransferase
LPPPTAELSIRLPSGLTIVTPPRYRDARTLAVGLYHPDTTALFEDSLHPGDSVVDLGAYIGYFAVLAAHLVGPRGNVYAFEPNPIAYRYLQRNVATNSCSNVRTLRSAVSNVAGTMRLAVDPGGPESFLVDSGQGAGVPVDVVTLDNCLAREGWPPIQLIKMNIEGSEKSALEGMRELSERNPDLKVIMEFNPKTMQRTGVSRHDLANTLTELGFRRGQIVERGLQALPARELLPRSSDVHNILLTK